MNRITLVIGHLGLGGAERVLCELAQRWTADGRSVTLLTLYQGAEPPFYQPPAGARWTDLDFPSIRRRSLPKMRSLACFRALRRAIVRSEPDVVVSFLTSTNVSVLIASIGLRVPVIVSERVNPRLEPISRRWDWLRARMYPRAAAIVVQTAAAADFFSGRARARTVTIPNAVPLLTGGRVAARAGRTLLGVGRLATQKRFDRLIAAYAALATKHLDWNLTIVGEGSERPALEKQIADSGLASRVFLVGRSDSPADYYRAASAFALTSDYEGFPNALCEAMAHGLPVVSTDCPSGPSEVIRDGVDGFLVAVDDQAALIERLDLLMSDAAERERLGNSARSVVERFSGDRIMTLWNALVDQVVHG